MNGAQVSWLAAVIP